MQIVDVVTKILSVLTILSHIGIAAVIIVLIITALQKRKKHLVSSRLFIWIGERGILFSFIVAIAATVGSLFYSEVAGYEPCKLCWYQRIFMYPLVLIFGLALGTKERIMMLYGIVFSIIGGLIAANHYYYQINKTTSLIPCDTIGYSVSCSDTFIMNFGYITIPMMALTAFILIGIGTWMASVVNKTR